MKVAILGCGPAGLLAAHAADTMRIDFDILAIKRPSDISGAQYIHEAIPTLDVGQPALVKYTKLGTREGYAEKVYGDPNAPCSWDLLPEGDHPAWPMKGIYELLWELYAARIRNVFLYPADVRPLVDKYDLVISTVPRRLLCLCRANHGFTSVKVVFRNRYVPSGSNYVSYNGVPGTDYYRSSNLFGHESIEYGAGSNAAQESAEQFVAGFKPLGNSCTCHPEVLFVGRFGKWQKGVLVHHAYQEVCSALHKL